MIHYRQRPMRHRHRRRQDFHTVLGNNHHHHCCLVMVWSQGCFLLLLFALCLQFHRHHQNRQNPLTLDQKYSLRDLDRRLLK